MRQCYCGGGGRIDAAILQQGGGRGRSDAAMLQLGGGGSVMRQW